MHNKRLTRLLALTLAMLLALFTFGCSMAEFGETLELVGEVGELIGEIFEESEEYPTDSQPTATSPPDTKPSETEPTVSEDGHYSSKDDVALYIHLYGHLPDNYITKSEANDLGWTGGSLEKYAKGCLIGGDRFGNRENLLPKKSGRTYTECDIDTLGKSSRGAKRIVFSNDGLVYYTDDHYESFTLLYGEE